jgi:hypothetical protein
MAIDYPVSFTLTLEPVARPWVRVHSNSIEYCQQLTSITQFKFDYVASGQQNVVVEMFDKSDVDPTEMIKIKNLNFYGISDPKFIWQGQYTPRYPEPWASQQKQQGIELEKVLKSVDCLGWNGVWQLTFDLPIFTWIHQVQNLGWIYS